MERETSENGDVRKAGPSKFKPNLKLRQAREARLLSQAKLAEEVGVTTRTIARWEQGEASPLLFNVQQLCRTLDRSPEDLGFENEQEQQRDQPALTSPTGEPELREHFERQQVPEGGNTSLKHLSRRKILVGIGISAILLGGAGYIAAKLLDPPEKKQLYRYYYKAQVTSLAWSPDEGGYLASAHEDHTVQVWNLTTGNPSSYTHHTSGFVNDVVWSPQGGSLASVSGGKDPTLRVWKFPLEKQDRLVLRRAVPLTTVGWSPDGKHLAFASQSQTVEILNLSAPQKTDSYTITGQHGIQRVRWSPDSIYVATGTTDGALHFRNTLQHADIYFREEHTGIVEDVAWSPNGDRLASASADGTVKVWDAVNGLVARTYRGHSAKVSSVAWSPDGQRVASASADGTVQLWNASTGKLLTSYPESSKGALNAVCWSPNGKYLAFASKKLEIEIWTVPS